MTSSTFIVSLVYKQKDFILLCMSGLEKGPASCLGQVDFPVRQVPLSFSLALGPRQVTCQQSHNKEKKKLRLALGKLEFKIFSKSAFAQMSKLVRTSAIYLSIPVSFKFFI